MKNKHKTTQDIQLLILDVDGVLSDGYIILDNQGNELKNFDVKDGLGMLLLQKSGVKIAIITGKSSQIVKDRFTALGIEDIFQGQKNKIAAYNQLKIKYRLQDSEIGYIGDDLPDLPLIKIVGFSAAPKDGVKFIRQSVDYVCKHKGGRGAVREICELILEDKGLLDKVYNDFAVYGEAKF